MTPTERGVLLPAPIAREIRSLNTAQKTGVTWAEDAVILAGPGAGKTKVLVAKAAYLAHTSVAAPHRIACLTYATKAANEIRTRLNALMTHGTDMISCNTVHAFCLGDILVPFAEIAGQGPIKPGCVITDGDRHELRIRAYDEAGLNEDPKWTDHRDIACRRAIYAGEDIQRFDPRVASAARAYEKLLRKDGLYDFEAMVGLALQILQQRPAIARILASKYPWLLVDEYQDLGPVLHAITMIMRQAGCHILAVGDPDQSIMGFTGSDPRYLRQLPDLGFKPIPLRVNYRAGKALVAAAALVLGEERGYEAHDPDAASILDHRTVTGDLQNHAAQTVTVVQELLSAGVSPHDVAVLYPRNRKRTPIKDWLVAAFNTTNIPILTERAQPWPRARVVRFLQTAASWQRTRQQATSHSVRFDALADQYAEIRAISWRNHAHRLSARVKLWEALTTTENSGIPLPAWVNALDAALELTGLLARDHEADELHAITELKNKRWQDTSVAEFAGDVESEGKLNITTYHSAKGREWPYIVLPALQEGVMPDWPLDYGKPYRPSQQQVAEERRLFYVALTRAQHAAVLLHTPGWTQTPIYGAPSRFIINLPGFAGP